jgi:hypothetical protein
MIIWIVALVVVGLSAVTGWNRGAVRAAISLAGLLVAALLAMPVGALIKPVISFLGVKHPFLLVFVAPVIAFFLVLILFKIGAHQVNTKIDYWYKYRANDMDRAHFDRMSRRVGLCVGLTNGVVYFIAMMLPFYVASYFTLQLPVGETPPTGLKLINQVGQQIRSAKLDKALAGYDPAPPAYYDAADIVGLVMNNYPLQSRLSRYPKMLELGERQEFQNIATDVEVNQLFAQQAPLSQLLENPKIQAVVTNREIAVKLQELLVADLKDLREYLETGISPKYNEEKILGLWVLTVEGSAAEAKKKNPMITSKDLNRFKSQLYTAYPNAELVVTTDHKAVLKATEPGTAAGLPRPLMRGGWKRADSGYVVTLTDTTKASDWTALVVGDQLFLSLDKLDLVFKREL